MALGLSISTDGKEARRRRALVLKQQGWQQQRIAAARGVSKGAVSQWMTTGGVPGEEGVRARPRSGAPPRLSAAALRLLLEFLAVGAQA